MPKNSLGMPQTEHELFILEAPTDEDVRLHRLDGQVLESQLKLTPLKPKYFKAENKSEFANGLIEFKRSGCRFLHISCHGNDRGTVFQLGRDSVNHNEIVEMLKGCLTNNRITFSACNAGRSSLFMNIIKRYKNTVQSVMGFNTTIDIELASAFWISYYTILTRLTYAGRRAVDADVNHIHVNGLAKIIEVLSSLFNVNVRLCYPLQKGSSGSQVWFICTELCVPKRTQWRQHKCELL